MSVRSPPLYYPILSVSHLPISLSMEMSRPTRDGTAGPVSRDQILRRANGDREEFIFPAQLTTSKIGNLTPPVDPCPCYM